MIEEMISDTLVNPEWIAAIGTTLAVILGALKIKSKSRSPAVAPFDAERALRQIDLDIQSLRSEVSATNSAIAEADHVTKTMAKRIEDIWEVLRSR